MIKVLRWIGILFSAIGALFTAVGVFIANAERDPFFLIFCAVGILFFVLGVGFLCFLIRHTRERARLLVEGTRIYADITGVRMDTRFRFNGRHPLVIDCQARNPEDGRVYVFHSEGIWYDPRPYLEDAGADTLPVYVDPGNYRRYAVDVSDVLSELG